MRTLPAVGHVVAICASPDLADWPLIGVTTLGRSDPDLPGAGQEALAQVVDDSEPAR